MKRIIAFAAIVAIVASCGGGSKTSEAPAEPIKLGIIGLDTSHSTAFTELLNSDSDEPFVREFEVVAAYPYGSKVIESSYKRIPGYIEEVKKYGVEIRASGDKRRPSSRRAGTRGVQGRQDLLYRQAYRSHSW